MKLIALFCLVGGVQGLFLMVHFWFKQSGKQVLNRLVAIMLMVYSVNLLNTYAFLEGFIATHEILQPISNYLGWWVGPSIYFYVSFPNIPTSWKKNFLIHYSAIIPIAIVGTVWPASVPYLGVLYYLQFSSYLAVSIYKVYKGETDRKLLSWIKPFIYAMGAIKLANVGMVALGITGIWTAPDTVRISFIILAAFPIFLIAYREMNATKTFLPTEDKYGESGVDDAEIQSYYKNIQTVIEGEQLYLDPMLKLEDVADKTGIHKRKISQVINETQGKNFSAYINDYRLQEVAERLTDPSNGHLSILGIARESGFNSGGRFNTLFKKEFGVTPSVYRKRAAQDP